MIEKMATKNFGVFISQRAIASYRKRRLIIVKGEQDIFDKKERFNEDDDNNVQRDLER
jgi:hypothetical protein